MELDCSLVYTYSEGEQGTFLWGIYVHESGQTNAVLARGRDRGRGRFCRNLGANLPNYPTHRETAAADKDRVLFLLPLSSRERLNGEEVGLDK